VSDAPIASFARDKPENTSRRFVPRIRAICGPARMGRNGCTVTGGHSPAVLTAIIGIVTLSDDAALDWHLDWKAAFPQNPAALIDVIIPILRHP
jgi:hypothetical protein